MSFTTFDCSTSLIKLEKKWRPWVIMQLEFISLLYWFSNYQLLLVTLALLFPETLLTSHFLFIKPSYLCSWACVQQRWAQSETSIVPVATKPHTCRLWNPVMSTPPPHPTTSSSSNQLGGGKMEGWEAEKLQLGHKGWQEGPPPPLHPCFTETEHQGPEHPSLSGYRALMCQLEETHTFTDRTPEELI